MDEKCDTSKASDKTNRMDLIDNLEYVSNAYFSAEQAFPFWESIFAIIIGQLIIAYFDHPNLFLILFGILFSIMWYRITTLSWHNSTFRYNTMKYLQWKLNKSEEGKKFYPESYIDEIIENKWMCENITSKKQSGWGISELFKWEGLGSTWWYRRVLPVFLFLFWIILLDLYLLKFYWKIGIIIYKI